MAAKQTEIYFRSQIKKKKKKVIVVAFVVGGC